jgi:hypothetical protein
MFLTALTLKDVNENDVVKVQELLKKEGFTCEMVEIGGAGVCIHNVNEVDIF